jgi:hypothetical protein
MADAMTLPEARAAYRTWPPALRDEIKAWADADPNWSAADWCRLAAFVRVSRSPSVALRLIREWRAHARAAADLRARKNPPVGAG